MPPSFSSYSSYWASRSGTTDAALDALRRESIVQSLVQAHENELDTQWEELENEKGKERQHEEEQEDMDMTPVPGRVHMPRAPPTRRYSIFQRTRAATDGATVAATEPPPSLNPWLPLFSGQRTRQHSRAASAPDLVAANQPTTLSNYPLYQPPLAEP